MGEKVKVLIIDDEADLCLLVKAQLERAGDFTVATLSDPRRAEEVVRREGPDLILCDVVMPQRKGDDIVRALRADAETKTIPIVMVSGRGEMVYNKKKDEFRWLPNSSVVAQRGDLPEVKGAEALAEAYGVDDYVAKPFKTELLIQVIGDVLKRRGRRSAAADEDQASET